MRPPSIPQRLHLIAEASPTHGQFRWQASLVLHASTLTINNSCPLTISNSITNVNQNPFQPIYDEYFHGNAFHMYLYHSLYFSLYGTVGYYLPRKQLSLTLYRALKNYEVPKVTQLLSGRGTFSKSSSWDSKSHVHSTSQQYPLQDHSCISIPEEAGQPTKLRPIKLRCPELQSTWYTTTTWAAKSQEQLHIETTCKISRKAYWWHCGDDWVSWVK